MKFASVLKAGLAAALAFASVQPAMADMSDSPNPVVRLGILGRAIGGGKYDLDAFSISVGVGTDMHGVTFGTPGRNGSVGTGVGSGPGSIVVVGPAERSDYEQVIICGITCETPDPPNP